jgi:hypothetical protein
MQVVAQLDTLSIIRTVRVMCAPANVNNVPHLQLVSLVLLILLFIITLVYQAVQIQHTKIIECV